MKHKNAEKLHAIRRFKQRLGVSLTEKQYHDLSQKCTDRNFAKFIAFTEEFKQILEIKEFGFKFRIVYNPIHFRIVTVLQPVYFS